MTHQLTRDEARRIAVRAQLLDADRPGDVVGVAEQLGQIKIDPVAAIAPAEHTILWSRIGSTYETVQLSKAVELDRLLFEYDGTFRPISMLPLILPVMRQWPQRQSTKDWLDANATFQADVLDRLRADGPLLASQIPDTAQVARAPDGWSGSNQVPIMLDFLHRQGVVAIVGREGRTRRWDLAERVYPQDLPEYSVEEAERLRNERRLQAFGIAKQKSPWTPVGDAGEPAVVEGSTLEVAGRPGGDRRAGGRCRRSRRVPEPVRPRAVRPAATRGALRVQVRARAVQAEGAARSTATSRIRSSWATGSSACSTPRSIARRRP